MSGTAPAAEPVLVLGVHPYLSYAELRLQFEPLAEYLSDALGGKVSLRIGSSYADHVSEIGQDRIDIVYIGPVSYVEMVKRFGRKPLLARLETGGDAELHGHLVVRHDSPLKSIRDLDGKSVGFGDPKSTMSSVVPKALLQRSGIPETQIESRRFRGHTSIALAVMSGQVDAGALKDEVYQRFAAQGLRSLHPLPPVSEHLFLAREGLPDELVAELRELLLSLNEDEPGRKVLKSLHPRATGLVPVVDEDYDALRDLLYAPVDTS